MKLKRILLLMIMSLGLVFTLPQQENLEASTFTTVDILDPDGVVIQSDVSVPFILTNSSGNGYVELINSEAMTITKGLEIEVTMVNGRIHLGGLEVSQNDGFEFWFSGNSLEKDGVLIGDPGALIIKVHGLREGISGQENFVANIDEQKPLSFFQGYLFAYDNFDGDVSSGIYVITDNYTTNKSVLGTHSVTFGVKDSNNNESTFTIKITVVDQTKPTITGNTAKVQISYTQTWTVESFRATLTATDNYDTLTNSQITLKSDGYTSNKTTLGTYNVVYSVIDSSGNEGTFTKQIEVIDDVAPTFSGKQTYAKDITSALTVNEIKANLTATDVKDGNRSAYITVKTDGYTGKGHIPGEYTIVFQVADTKGNTATFNVIVTVIDNIPPVWYVADGTSIVLIEPMVLTQNQIIDLLTKTGQISIGSTSEVVFFMDEYTGNETMAGVYNVGFNIKSASGESSVQNLTITVFASDETPIIVKPETNLFTTIGNWIKDNVVISVFIGLAIIGVVTLLIKNKKEQINNKNYRRRG